MKSRNSIQLDELGASSSSVSLKETKLRPGGGGAHGGTPPLGFGGEDSGGWEGPSPVSYHHRLKRCRLGLALSLISVLMLFLALTAAFLLRQHGAAVDDSGHNISGWQPLTPPPLLLVNTLILLVSSITLEAARRSMRQRALLAPLETIPGVRPEPRPPLPWLEITLVLGLGFLAGQGAAWHDLQQRGFYLAGNPSASFFYLLTGAHAVHLTVGIAALCYATLAQLSSHRLETRCLVVDVTSWYWHFMTILWIGLYLLLLFAS